MKRFATFETSSHFKFFDDFASKASASFDVVVVVALLLVVVVLRFLLRVFVLSFVFLRAVIKRGTDGDDDFDEQQHVFVERVVAVVKVVISRDTAFWKKSLSLSSFYSQTKKKATFRERERESFQKREKEKKQFLFRQRQKNAFRALKVCVII